MEEHMESKGKERGCGGMGCMLVIGIFLGVGTLLVGISILGWSVSSNSSPLYKMFSDSDSVVAGEDEFPEMEETWSSGNGDTKTVRIPLNGMITLGRDSSWSSGNAAVALRSIRRATLDEDVDGLILEIDSGGGGITASDILYKAVKDFKAAKKGRRVVTIMGDVAASGAYYVALASDYILAHPTTLTGSIGVIMQSYNIKGLAQKIGISDVTVKSGVNKDLLNPFRDVSPEQKELLQKVIDSMYNRFVSLVVENRKLAREKVLSLADGRVFVAPEAVAEKLIDGIGYRNDASKKLAALLDVEEVKVYRYSEKMTLRDFFGHSGIGLESGFSKMLQGSLQEPQLLYRWNP